MGGKRTSCSNITTKIRPFWAREKVRRYEAASRSDAWRSQWEVDTFPAVLVVFRHATVGDGYLDAIREHEQVRVTYYGKRLDGVLAKNLAEWRNVASGQREAILGKGGEARA